MVKVRHLPMVIEPCIWYLHEFSPFMQCVPMLAMQTSCKRTHTHTHAHTRTFKHTPRFYITPQRNWFLEYSLTSCQGGKNCICILSPLSISPNVMGGWDQNHLVTLPTLYIALVWQWKSVLSTVRPFLIETCDAVLYCETACINSTTYGSTKLL